MADYLIILNKSEEFKKIPSSKLKKLNKRLFIIDPNYICNNLEKIYKNKYISVGKATSKVLKSYGIKNIETSFIETAEGVLDILRMCDLKKETFFYPHSELSSTCKIGENAS